MNMAMNRAMNMVMPSIDIAVEAGNWSLAGDLPALCERAVAATLAQTGIKLAPKAELSLLFTDDAAIQVLNRTWRGMDKPTNVLSFPAVAPSALAHAPLLGDIACAAETIQNEAEQQGKTFVDHLTHMVVHGFLHILGFDHEKDEDAVMMEEHERAILAQLAIADPYAEGEL